MRVIANLSVNNASKAVRRAAVAGSNALILGTSVDTGRARGNYVITIGGPRFEVSDNVDPSGSGKLSEAQAVIAKWKVGKGPIFMTNSLPYIQRLDNGYSAQAPQGMSNAAILAMRVQLAKARLLK